MNNRERFHAVMNFEPVDRLPFMEFMGYWPETLERWHAEGLPANVQPRDYYLGAEHIGVEGDVIDPRDHFGLDHVESVPLDFNLVPPFEVELIEEDELTQTLRDETGVLKKVYKNSSAMPHYLEFPIKTREDYLAFRERLDPDSPGRYPADWDARVAALRKRDFPIYLICRGPFAFCRDFMHFEELMRAVMMQPEWVREMMNGHTDFLIRFWDRALHDLDIDFIYLGEDMAFKNGPMLAPDMARELLMPNYRRIVDCVRECGVRHIIVDSDGDVSMLVPMLLEAGVTGILPLERTGTCHPVELRRRFPRLQMIGGIDKQAIARGGEVMRREVHETVGPLTGGGYIPCFDHSVHPLVSWPTYQEYLETLREAVGHTV